MNWLTTSAPDWSQTLSFLLDSALKGSVVIAIAAVAAVNACIVVTDNERNFRDSLAKALSD